MVVVPSVQVREYSCSAISTGERDGVSFHATRVIERT